TAADELVAGCSACADLAADLRALARATHDLPPADRPRDFFLTPADAERLRPRGLRRLLAAFAAPTAPIRPLATGLTTLGVAGLLLAALPGILPIGGAASMPLAAVGDSVAPQEAEGEPPAAAPSSAPEPGTGASQGRDTSGSSDDYTSGSGGTPTGENSGEGGSTDGGVRLDSDDDAPGFDLLALADDGGPSVLIVLSGSFLIVGLGLFALRWTGRRLGSG
ncbi:MAG TPA: hypothetical protein VFR14_05795, partial [Candidatus Limnocylindrales bacterium]|nr:hypothetical protein [Candidatus Limnocylindrales bacterium]